MSIGSGFSCERGLWLEAVPEYQGRQYKPRIRIGRNVACSQHVHISCAGHLEIGNDVLVGSFVYIGDHNHGDYTGLHPDTPDVPPSLRPLSTMRPLVIEDNVFIGDKVTISGGLTIGRGTIIAANSVVTRSLPPMCMAAGNPARVIKTFDQASKTWKTVARDAGRPTGNGPPSGMHHQLPEEGGSGTPA